MQKIRLLLTTIKQTKKIYLLVYGLVGLTMVGTVLVLLTPQTDPSTLKLNYDGSRSRFSNLSYTGESIVIPESLPFFQFLGWEDAGALQNQLLSQLGVTIDEFDPELWRNESVIVAKIDNPLRFSIEYLTEQNEEAPDSNLSIEPTEVNPVVVAESWVREYLGSYGLSLIARETEYYIGEYELKPAPESLATLARYTFAQTVSQYPIRTEALDGYPVFVYVSLPNPVVTKAVVYPTLLKKEYVGDAPTISVEEAIENINSNQDAKIIYAKQTDWEEFSLERIKDGLLNTGALEYRLVPGDRLLPHYRFGGTLVTSDNTRVSAEIVVPAI